MRYAYRAYGLNISSNEPIEFLALSLSRDSDIAVDFHDANLEKDDNGVREWGFGDPPQQGPSAVIDVFHKPDRHKFRYYHPNGTFLEFIVTATNIEVYIPETIPRRDAVSFLLGPVLAIACRLRETSCLHASVLAFKGNAFALIGEKRTGKSTTAAMLTMNGAQLIADDIAVLCKKNRQYHVYSAYPYMRLSREIAALINIDVQLENTVQSAGDEKYYVPTRWRGERDDQFPLQAIYLLMDRETAKSPIEINTMSSGAALRALNSNSHVRYAANENMRRQDYKRFAELARKNMVRAVSRPDDLGKLEDLCQHLMDDFRCNIS